MNTGTPTFSLAYTSVRPAILPQIVKLWDERSKYKDHEWSLSYDAGHDATRASAIAVKEQYTGNHPVVVSVNEGRKNCVDGWNTAAAATKGKVIIAVADDFVPPVHWDEALLSLEPKGWVDNEHVVHVNDGFIGHIFTLAILTRKRYDRFGYLWYPGYESMFVDTEFGEVAKRDGVVIEAMHLLFEHMHHACGKRPKDTADTNHENKVRWSRGEMLFNYRKERGFPLDLGPKCGNPSPVQITPEHVGKLFSALFQLNCASDTLFQSCERLYAAGIKAFHFAVLSEYPDGRKVTTEDVTGIAAVTDRLKQLQDTKVNTKIFKLPMYRYPGESRPDFDKRLQNDIAAWVRADGYADFINVDPTVLWQPAKV